MPGFACSMMPMGMPSAASPTGMLSPGTPRGQSTIVNRVYTPRAFICISTPPNLISQRELSVPRYPSRHALTISTVQSGCKKESNSNACQNRRVSEFFTNCAPDITCVKSEMTYTQISVKCCSFPRRWQLMTYALSGKRTFTPSIER